MSQMEFGNKCCKFFKDEDVSSVPGDTLPKFLQSSIDNIIKKKEYKTCNVYTKQVSTEGGNYLGSLYEVDIKGKTPKGNKESNIFIKVINDNGHFEVISVPEAYLKESYAYNELSKIFKELQDDANVPEDERFKMAKSYDESNSEAILLENLAKKGFTTPHRMEVISLKFAELSIQHLARFHGLSYVMQEKKPTYFDKKLKSMKHSFHFNDNWKSFVTHLCETSSQSLDYVTKKRIQSFIPTIIKKYPEYMDDNTLVGSCVCHGDYRANNILMKEIDGEVKEVVPVDFQLLHYGCPVNDFLYFIFTGTDQEFRRKHLSDLKNLYYETLEIFLQYFDMDVTNIYPRKEFERQYKERLDYGLMVVLMLGTFLFASEDDLPDISNNDIATKVFKLDKRYEARIMGVVDDLTQWGCL